jgi:hypothetical protein
MPDPTTGAGFDAPTPETAYANAPSCTREISAVVSMAADRIGARRTGPALTTATDREFWLRKAALLDRIAISDGTDNAITAAAESACRLAEFDREHPDMVAGPHGPEAIEWDPSHRPYVRQEYAALHHTPHLH